MKYDNTYFDQFSKTGEPICKKVSIYDFAQGYQPMPPEKPKKPRRSFSKKAVALLVSGCLLLSLGTGFGGALLAQRLTDAAQEQVVQIGGTVVATNQSTVAGETKNSDSSADAMTVAQIAATAANSVVEITTEAVQTSQWMQQYIAQGAGSGVVLSKDGYIVTNNHVIEGAEKITVCLKDGTSYTAKLVGRDEDTDIAVIKIDATDLQPAVFGDSDQLSVGELAVAIGNPLGQLGGTVTDGIISALNREISIEGQSMNLLQTNAAINPGNSGGGLFNSQGQLIGIVNAKSSGSGVEGLGFAIPINAARPIIENLIQYGYVVGRADTGLTLLEISDAYTAMMYRVQQTGLYISDVQKDSNAQSAGFQSGDLITKVNGTLISTESEFKKAIADSVAGDSISVTIIRGGQEQIISLLLAQYVPDNGQVTI